MYASTLVALVAALSPVSAGAAVGFNYGSNYTNGTVFQQSDYQSMFQGAQKLTGTNGMFSTARLYTTIQGGSTSDPTSAIPAAIATKTRLLLGLWASSGGAVITNEITALTTAIKKYGSSFTDLVEGISVGSEDLYRVTPTSHQFDPTLTGAGPDDIVSYINQLRSALKGTALSGAKIGHVDTWTAWTNSSNNKVTQACDWIGTDIYPYFENQQANGIDQGKALYDDAWQQTQNAAQGKEVWVTETAWPLSGATQGQAVPSTNNAEQYYQSVGCGELFGKVNTYWFQYFDEGASPGFGVVDSVGGSPKFKMSCDKSAASTQVDGNSTLGGANSISGSSGSSNSTSGSGSSNAGSGPAGSASSNSTSSGSSSSSSGTSSPTSASSAVAGSASASASPANASSSPSSAKSKASTLAAPAMGWMAGAAAVFAALIL